MSSSKDQSLYVNISHFQRLKTWRSKEYMWTIKYLWIKIDLEFYLLHSWYLEVLYDIVLCKNQVRCPLTNFYQTARIFPIFKDRMSACQRQEQDRFKIVSEFYWLLRLYRWIVKDYRRYKRGGLDISQKFHVRYWRSLV